jgi:hypothetical protein
MADEFAEFERCARDFKYYAEHFLFIKDKAGTIIPLKLNSAQARAHAACEEQLARKGRVRLIVVKGRQQGLSTYFQARQRWKTKHAKGALKSYTVSHEIKSTNNMLEMQRVFQVKEPDWARPKLLQANANEIVIAANRARIEVVTAGTGNVGRSGTSQILHGSEAAFWSDPKATWAALGQVLPLADGTEAYIESTGDGPNDFAERVRQAQDGKSDYEVLFIPWFLQTEYAIDPPAGFIPDEEEVELAEAYDLNSRQLAWRRLKIATDFPDDPTRFQHEYPNTIEEAFSVSARHSFLPMALVVKSQKREMPAAGKLLVALDPGFGGEGDACGVTVRKGRRVLAMRNYHGKNTMDMAGILAKLIEKHKDTDYGIMCFVDVNGLGAGVYDRLVELGYEQWVTPVMASEAALDERRYANRRAEMGDDCLQWMKIGCQLPPGTEVLRDLTATGRDMDSAGRLRLQGKKAIKKESGISPGLFDSLTYTFANPTNIERLKHKTVDDGSYDGRAAWDDAS